MDEIVPNASYLVYECDDGITDKVYRHSQLVHFYTAEGEHIQEIQHDNQFTKMKDLLDPTAPLPRPVRYAIKYWHGYEDNPNTGMPGHFVIFYDKNKNRIKSYRFDPEARQIIISQQGEQKDLCPIRQLQGLDLSLIPDEQKSPRTGDVPKVEKEKCCLQ
jgi:hypothetical protein